jgi:hypothetical protein
MTFRVLFISMLFLYGKCALAEKNIIHQSLIWYNYIQNLKINDRFTLQTDIQERHFINPLKQSQFTIRPTFKTAIKNNWDIGIGFCVFLNNSDPTVSYNLNIPELRPYLEANHQQKFKRVSTLHRFRIESRFFQNTEDEQLRKGFSFNSMRFRYQFGIDILLNKPKDEKHALKLRILDEFMLNFGKNIVYNLFDQNRISLFVQYAPVKAVAIEVGYINWFQQRISGSNFFSRNIFRLGIVHNIVLHKSEKKTLN